MTISIIIATYNSAATLRDSLKSIRNQTYNNYEIIIIDGSSSDGTVALIRGFEPIFGSKMKWVSEPDKGIYDAMNKGIRAASGDIVGILNSDDFYTSNDILETVAKAFEEDPDLDAVYADVHYCKWGEVTSPVRYYSSKVFRPFLMRLGFMPAHPSFYVRKEVYEKVGLFDTSFKIAADFDILLRMIFLNRIKTKYIEKDFVTMRVGGVSSSGYQSHKLINKEHLASLKKNGVKSNVILLSLRYLYKIYELAVSKRKLRHVRCR